MQHAYIDSDLYFPKRAWAEIDLDAIEKNFDAIQSGTSASVMPVIKANGYGHGAVKVAKLLEKKASAGFAVSSIDEAEQLRDAGIKSEVLILGYTPVECAGKLSEHNFTQCIYSREYAEALNRQAKEDNAVIRCHLKLDTGMGRIGFNCRSEELAGIEDALYALSCGNLEFTGVFTHFSSADSRDKDDIAFTEEQYSRFDRAVKILGEHGYTFQQRHCDNSAAILDRKCVKENVVRAGTILYGFNPSPELDVSSFLSPAMSFYSVVSMVKEVYPGDTISYGRTYKVTEKRMIATVTAGYADGIPRLLSNRGHVVINGRRAPITGNICMDQFCVDVTDIPSVKTGDTVTVWGEGLSIEEVAACAETIDYEIICGVSPRVPRVYKKTR